MKTFLENVFITLYTGYTRNLHLSNVFLPPLITAKDPNAIDLMQIEMSPEHWFGTNSLGRDILVRIAAGIGGEAAGTHLR